MNCVIKTTYNFHKKDKEPTKLNPFCLIVKGNFTNRGGISRFLLYA